MAKDIINLREELRAYRFEFDLLQKIPCTKQENKDYKMLLEEGCALPEGVFPYTYDDGETSKSEFYTVYETDFTEFEKIEYLTYRKLGLLKTIKNCAMFFTALTIIGMIAGFLIAA